MTTATPGATFDAVRWTIAHAWGRFWFSRFDPISIGVFRIFIGCLMVFFYLALFPNWERFYAADGIRAGDEFPRSVFSLTEWLVPVRVFWMLGLAAAIVFTVGWQTRFCTIVLFILQTSMVNRTPQVTNGEDLVFRMLLFWGMFAPLGHRLSVDRALRARRGLHEEALPTGWAVRGMQINFALIYAISLPNKLVDDVAWWSGDAVYLAVVSSTWGRWGWPEMFYAADGLLSKVFTYGTILVEGAFPILVWFPRTVIFAVGAAALLHIGIAMMLNGVTFFSLAMACGLWMFVPPEATRRLIRWVSG